jgi:hypothetical protein
MKKIIIFLALVVLGISAWYLVYPAFNVVEMDEISPLMDEETKKEFERQMNIVKDDVKEMEDPMLSDVNLVLESEFKASAHEVSGKAVLINNNENKILRFENFETINGPNLHIYLSKDLKGEDFIDLGEIRATKGNVNYEIPNGVDLSEYNKVLVWCVPFKVLFSYADLSVL